MPDSLGDTYGGHWVAAGSHEVFELARCPAVSNDHDLNNERRGYKGISIPTASRVSAVRGGILKWTSPSTKPTAPCSTRTFPRRRSSAGSPSSTT